MWPFKTELANDKQSAFDESVAKLKAFRDVGETFNYLGRTCVVTGHTVVLPYLGFVPALEFDYCDDLGVIHSMRAYGSELPALIKQQTEINGQVKTKGTI